MPLRRPPGSLSRIPDRAAERNRFRKCRHASAQRTRLQPSSPVTDRAATPCAAGRRSLPSADFPSPHPHRKEMETVGFEPTTPCLQSRCSPTELRPRGRGCQQLHPRNATGHRLRNAALHGNAGPPFKPRLNGTLRAGRSIPWGIASRPRRDAMVGQGGLEPPTPRLSSVCSNQLSYWPRTRGVAQSGKDARSAPAMARGHDQARRQGRSARKQPGMSVIDMARAPPPHPGQPTPRHVQGKIVMSDTTQGSRGTRQAGILERR